MTTTTAHEYEYYTDGDYDLRALLLHLYDVHGYDGTTYDRHPSNLGEREVVERYSAGGYRETYEARLTLNAVHETLHQYNIGEAV